MSGSSKKSADSKKKTEAAFKRSDETIKKRKKSVEFDKETTEPHKKKSVEFRNKVDERTVDEFLVTEDNDDDSDETVVEYYKSEEKRTKSDESSDPSGNSSKSTYEEVTERTHKSSKKNPEESVEKPTKKLSKKKVVKEVIESESGIVDREEIEEVSETVEHKKIKSEDSHKKSKKEESKYEEREEKKSSKSSKHKSEEVVSKSNKSSKNSSDDSSSISEKHSKSSSEGSSSKSQKYSKGSSKDLSLDKSSEKKFEEILLDASANDISVSKSEGSIDKPSRNKSQDSVSISEMSSNISLENLIEKPSKSSKQKSSESIEYSDNSSSATFEKSPKKKSQTLEKTEISHTVSDGKNTKRTVEESVVETETINGLKSEKSSKRKTEESIPNTETNNNAKSDKSSKEKSDKSIVKAEDSSKKSDESIKKSSKTKLEEWDKIKEKATDKLIQKIDEITGKIIRVDNSDEEIVMTALIKEKGHKRKDGEGKPGPSADKNSDGDDEILEEEDELEGLSKIKGTFKKKKVREETIGAVGSISSGKFSNKSLDKLKDEEYYDEETKSKNWSFNEEPDEQDQSAYADAPAYYATIERWGYAIFKKAVVLGAVYLVGYMNWSVAWLIGPLIILVVRDEMQRKGDVRRSIAKALAGKEKVAAQLKFGDLPAWVIYPDVERAEWVNLILEQVWPSVNHYAREYIKDVIEPAVAQTIQGFRFDRIILGNISPKVGGVKVYDRNVSRNEIIIDIDMYYSGNCDITFVLKGVRGGMKDFQINGILRLVLKPLIPTMPFFGGVQMFFLNNPNIDFNMVGVADILNMPGLRDMLRYMFIEQVAALMVLPNKLVISMSDSVPLQTLRMPEAEGVLRVHVIEAKHLINADFGFLTKIKSDPYVIVNVGAQEMRTSVISNNLNPKWDQWCEAVVETIEQTLFLEVWDRDDTLGTKDDNLGRASIEISSVARRGHVDQWLTLEQVPHGLLHVRLFWMSLSHDPRDLNSVLQEQSFLTTNGLNTSLLTIFVDCAKSLPRARVSSQPDPFVLLSVGNTTQKTLVCARTTNPTWEEAFTFMVFNPMDDSLNIKILDQKTSNQLGEMSYSLSYLMRIPRMEITNEEFYLLSSSPDSKIVLCLRLRIMKHQGPSADLMENSDESSMYSKGKDFISPGKTSHSDIMSNPQKPQAKAPEPEPREPKKSILPEDLTQKLSQIAPQAPVVTPTLPVHVKLVKSPACIPKGPPQGPPQCPPVVTACPVSECVSSVQPNPAPIPCPTESQSYHQGSYSQLPYPQSPYPQTSFAQSPYAEDAYPQTSYSRPHSSQLNSSQPSCPPARGPQSNCPPCPQPPCPQPSCPPPSCPPPSCPQPSCPQPSYLQPPCPQPSYLQPPCPQPSCPMTICPEPSYPQLSYPQSSFCQLNSCPQGPCPIPTMYTPMPFPQTSYGLPACPPCSRPSRSSRPSRPSMQVCSSVPSCLKVKGSSSRQRVATRFYDCDPMEAVSSTTSTHGIHDMGRARISVSYDPCTEILTVFVHNIMDLPLKEDGNCPDTYVKVYAIPGGRKKETLYKTEVVKDDCNPVFEEKFEFTLAKCDLHTARVELMVFEKKLVGGNPLLGRICVDLKQYDVCCRCQIICCDMCPVETPKTSKEEEPKKKKEEEETKKKEEEKKREVEDTIKRREEIIKIIEERQKIDIEEQRKLIVEEIRKKTEIEDIKKTEDTKSSSSISKIKDIAKNIVNKKEKDKKEKKKKCSSSSDSCCSCDSCDSCDSCEDICRYDKGCKDGRSGSVRKRRGSRSGRRNRCRRGSCGGRGSADGKPILCDQCSYQNVCVPVYYDQPVCAPPVVHAAPPHPPALCCQAAAAACASKLCCAAACRPTSPCCAASVSRMPACGKSVCGVLADDDLFDSPSPPPPPNAKKPTRVKYLADKPVPKKSSAKRPVPKPPLRKPVSVLKKNLPRTASPKSEDTEDEEGQQPGAEADDTDTESAPSTEEVPASAEAPDAAPPKKRD